MDIHLIDEFRRRTNASYDEARVYLERFNGDLLEAIIAFERERTSYQGKPQQTRSGNFFKGLIRVIQTLFDIKLVVTDRNMKVYNVPIIIPIVLFPVGHVLLIMAIVLWIMGFRFSFRREPDQNVNIEAIFDKLREKVNETGKKF